MTRGVRETCFSGLVILSGERAKGAVSFGSIEPLFIYSSISFSHRMSIMH